VPASLALNSATKVSYAKQLANLIKERHQSGTLTLIVVNRVKRAREVFQTLIERKEAALRHEKGSPHSLALPSG
jgi:CRISPR/Cas system-associated endonuclease/helicase Cas3